MAEEGWGSDTEEPYGSTASEDTTYTRISPDDELVNGELRAENPRVYRIIAGSVSDKLESRKFDVKR